LAYCWQPLPQPSLFVHTTHALQPFVSWQALQQVDGMGTLQPWHCVVP
jgi:hypothetical protein